MTKKFLFNLSITLISFFLIIGLGSYLIDNLNNRVKVQEEKLELIKMQQDDFFNTSDLILSAPTRVGPGQGGTGTTTTPSAGSLLIGNGTNGRYDVSTLTAGKNITIGNADGSITITSARDVTVSTSSTPTLGALSYWTTSGAYPETLGSIATTTLTEDSSYLSLSNAISVLGASASVLSLDTSFLSPYSLHSFASTTYLTSSALTPYSLHAFASTTYATQASLGVFSLHSFASTTYATQASLGVFSLHSFASTTYATQASLSPYSLHSFASSTYMRMSTTTLPLLTTLSGLVNSTTTNATTTSFFGTNFRSTGATTTNLSVLTMTAASCDVKARTDGSFYCGTDADSGGTFSWTVDSTYNEVVNSTSTPILFDDTIYASSTSFFSNDLTITGNTADLYIPDKIYHSGDTDTYIYFDLDRIYFNVGGSEFIVIDQNTNKIEINDDGIDIDFIIEGVDDVVLFKTDAALNNVGIGTSSPYAKLSVTGNAVFDSTISFDYFTSTSTSATSTMANGLQITGGGLTLDNFTNCNLDTDSNGHLVCGTDASGSGAAFAWTPNSNIGNATSTTLFLDNGFSSLASSTILNLSVTNLTATTTLDYWWNNTSGITGLGVYQIQGTLNATTSTIDNLVINTTIDIPAGEVDAGDYAAASIDGDDVNSNIAGRSLTLTAASPDTLDADAELYTGAITFGFATSTISTTTNYMSHRVANAITITRADGHCFNQGTTTIDINQNGSSIFGYTFDMGSFTASQGLATSSTAFADATVPAGSYLTLDVDGYFYGLPTNCEITLTYTKDD